MILKTIPASIRLSSKLSLAQSITWGLVYIRHPHHLMSLSVQIIGLSTHNVPKEQIYFVRNFRLSSCLMNPLKFGWIWRLWVWCSLYKQLYLGFIFNWMDIAWAAPWNESGVVGALVLVFCQTRDWSHANVWQKGCILRIMKWNTVSGKKETCFDFINRRKWWQTLEWWFT